MACCGRRPRVQPTAEEPRLTLHSQDPLWHGKCPKCGSEVGVKVWMQTRPSVNYYHCQKGHNIAMQPP